MDNDILISLISKSTSSVLSIKPFVVLRISHVLNRTQYQLGRVGMGWVELEWDAETA